MKTLSAVTKVLSDTGRVWLKKEPEKALVTFFEITMACNLKCSYCYIANEPENYPEGSHAQGLTTDQICRVLDEIRKSSHAISLYGGEPFVHPDFDEIVAYAKQKEFSSLETVTNGTLLKKNLDTTLSFDVINISYDLTRRREYGPAMKKVLRNAEELKQKHNQSFMFIATVAKDDPFEEMRPFLSYLRKNDFLCTFQPVRENGKVSDLEWFNEFMARISKEFKGVRLFNQPGRYTASGFATCLPKIAMSVTWKGDLLYPCQYFRNRVAGSLLKDSVETLWEKGKKEYGQFPSRECEKCGFLCMMDLGYNIRHPWHVDFFRY